MSKKHLFLAMSGLASLMLFGSCQDEDYGVTTQEIRNATYKKNFEDFYGEIANDQIWDFSSYNLAQLGLSGGPSQNDGTRASGANNDGSCTGVIDGATQGTGIHTASTNYYTVDPATVTWLNNNLKEGKDNRTLGDPFVLVKPSNKFVIIPIYQGNAGMRWDLHLVAEDPTDNVLKDYQIWTKSQGIKYTVDYKLFAEYNYDSGKDVSDWGDNNGGKKGILDLSKGFQYISSAITSGTDDDKVMIKFEIPNVDGAYLYGQFKIDGNVVKPDAQCDGDGNYKFEKGTTTIVDLSSIDKSSLSRLKFDFWQASNGGPKGENIVNSYNPEYRVKISTKYNYVLVDHSLESDLDFITGHTIDRTEVNSKGIVINVDKIKDEFFLYLDVTYADDYNASHYADPGTKQRSDRGQMLALTSCTRPTELTAKIKELVGSDFSSEAQYMVVGCEDANKGDSDWDLNDVCFLLVGLPEAPKIQTIISKRYMIEDLGSTFDFDFNDIVIDVTEKTTKTAQGEQTGKFAYATLRHLCGTIPFRIKIGDKVLGLDNGAQGVFAGNNGGGSGYDPTNDPNYAKLMNVEVTGKWIPNENNITVTSWPSQAGAGWDDIKDAGYQTNYLGEKGGETFQFPEVGHYPYIIACNQNTQWMPELVAVPTSWFKTWKADDYINWPQHGTDNGGVQSSLAEGNVIFENTSKEFGNDWTSFDIAKDKLKLHEGDELIFKISDPKSDAAIELFNLNWGEQTRFENLEGDFSVEVTKAVYDKYKDGLKIQGHNVNLISVSKNCSHVPSNPITATHIDEGDTKIVNDGDHVIDHWDGYTIDKSKFSNVKVNDVIIVHVKDIYENSQYSFRNGDDWTQLPGCDEYKELTGDFELTVTADIRDVLKEKGLVLTGKFYTITKVTLSPAPLITYLLTTNVTGNGSISKSPNKDKYEAGETVTLTAVPADIRYKFTSWSDDSNAGAQRTITMDADKSFTANFGDNNDVVSITASVVGELGGSVAVSTTEAYTPALGGFYKGSAITITATLPEGDYRVKEWKKGDQVLSEKSNTITISAEEDASYTVEFEEKPSENVVFEGNKSLSNWGYFHITNFESPNAGEKMVIEVSTYEEGKQLIIMKADENTQIKQMTTSNMNWGCPYVQDGKVEFVLSESDVQALGTDFVIKSEGTLTLNKVSFVPSE